MRTRFPQTWQLSRKLSPLLTHPRCAHAPNPGMSALQAWLSLPCTRDSLAKSLQSDLRWMIILVPVLTPEASAISNTPELKHTESKISSAAVDHILCGRPNHSLIFKSGTYTRLWKKSKDRPILPLFSFKQNLAKLPKLDSNSKPSCHAGITDLHHHIELSSF